MTPKALFATSTAFDRASIGLLILRLAGLSLFVKHGLEKLTGYSTMVHHFPDPIHVGAHVGLAFALLSDGICSCLFSLDWQHVPAAAVILTNLLVAFVFVHHAAYYYQRSRRTRGGLHHRLCRAAVHGTWTIQCRQSLLGSYLTRGSMFGD